MTDLSLALYAEDWCDLSQKRLGWEVSTTDA